MSMSSYILHSIFYRGWTALVVLGILNVEVSRSHTHAHTHINVNKKVIPLVNGVQEAVPLAARSKAWVCGRSLAAIVGSNPVWGMVVCLL
jgi:hypothetical protein